MEKQTIEIAVKLETFTQREAQNSEPLGYKLFYNNFQFVREDDQADTFRVKNIFTQLDSNNLFTREQIAGSNNTLQDNQSLHEHFGQKLVDNAVNGISSCFLFLGQREPVTDSFIIGSRPSANLFVFKTVSELFGRIQESAGQCRHTNGRLERRKLPKHQVEVSMYFLELTKICDLLGSSKLKKIKKVRESKSNGIYIPDLKHQKVDNYKMFQEVVGKGFARLERLYTLMGGMHRYFPLFLDLRLTQNEIQHEVVKQTTSNLKFVIIFRVDQNVSRRRLSRHRQLLFNSLRRVVQSLKTSSQISYRTFVPYRDSKLTRLLQDDLKGKSRIYVLGSVCPSENHRNLNLQMLELLRNFEQIPNQPKVNCREIELQ